MNRKLTGIRITMMICGALAVLFFFILPLYYITIVIASQSWSPLQYLILLGKGTQGINALGITEELTGLSTNFIFMMFVLTLPVILGILLFVFALIGGKLSKIGGIICSCLMIAAYLIPIFVRPFGFIVSMFYYVTLIVALLALVMAILDKDAAEEYGSDGRDYYSYHDDNNFGEGRYGTVDDSWGTPVPDNWNNGYSDTWGGDTEGAPVYRNEGTITCVRGDYRNNTLTIRNGETIIIGRSPGQSDLVLSDPSVSRTHCRITYYAKKDAYYVEDLSKYGIFDPDHNRKLAVHGGEYLAPGDQLRIGKTDNIFRFE